jgi:hypothetical protein
VTPGPLLVSALDFVDRQVGAMTRELTRRRLDDTTRVILSAKHGQSPQNSASLIRIDDGTILDGLDAAWKAAGHGSRRLLAMLHRVPGRPVAGGRRNGASRWPRSIASLQMDADCESAGGHRYGEEPSAHDIGRPVDAQVHARESDGEGPRQRQRDDGASACPREPTRRRPADEGGDQSRRRGVPGRERRARGGSGPIRSRGAWAVDRRHEEQPHALPGEECQHVGGALRAAGVGSWRQGSHSTREFLAGVAIAQQFGRPHTPEDQAWIETLFGHVKGEWPHLERIRDPGELDCELDRRQLEYNTVRLHAGIGYVTPDDEHTGRGEGIRQARRDGLIAARQTRINYRRTTTEDHR